MKRIAYLTIDDAPRKDFKKKLLLLKSFNMPAVFYCTGQGLEAKPDDAVFALMEGYVIGNHSYSHPHFSELTYDQAVDEIEKTDFILQKIYAEAGKEIIRTFRFPYGDKGWGSNPGETVPSAEQKSHYEKIQKFLLASGYAQPEFPGLNNTEYLRKNFLKDVDVFWTFDCREWEYDGTEQVYEKILNRMDIDDPENWFGLNSGTSAEIILTHDHDETTPLFETLIMKLAAKNFEYRLPEFKKN